MTSSSEQVTVINCCNAKNPLVRNGTSQGERRLKALDPGYVQIDENEIQDLVAFAHKYASLVNYYDGDNFKRDDWTGFFEISTTVMLAIISVGSHQSVREDIDTLFKTFKEDETAANVTEIIRGLFSLVGQINEWYKKLSPSISLKAFILSDIETTLFTWLHRLIEIDKSIGTTEDYSAFYHENAPSGINFLTAEPSSTPDFPEHPEWFLNETTFTALSTTSVADLKAVVADLKQIYKHFFQVYVKTVQKAGRLFESNIKTEDTHYPHITLFIAFLYLFRHAQNDINTLTGRHLDFYYNDVLRLKKLDQVPDEVHLLFELAKNKDLTVLKKGTLLKAGKDDEGNNLFYELPAESSFNTAAVDEIKTITLDPNNSYKVFAAPVANSGDGKGGDFSDDSSENWKPFGSAGSPAALIGMAISSPLLLLKEGERTLTLTLNIDSAIALTDLQTYFRIELSTEESWLEIPEYTSDDGTTNSTAGFTVSIETADFPSGNIEKGALTFVITLHSGDPAIVPFDPEVLKGGFSTSWPVIKILLNEKASDSVYEELANKKIKTIECEVSSKGIRNIILQNDQSVFPTDSAFLPFGPRPTLGSNVYIGSEEVFAKKIDRMDIEMEWLDLPPSGDFAKHYCVYNQILGKTINNNSFTVKVDYLKDKVWKPLFDGDAQKLFKSPPVDYIMAYQMFSAGMVYEFNDITVTNDIMTASGTSAPLKTASGTSAPLKTASGTSAPLMNSGGILNEAVAKKAATLTGENDPVYVHCGGAEDTTGADSVGVSLISLESDKSIGSGKNINEDNSNIGDFERYKGLLEIEKYTSGSQRGFIRLQLCGEDFQHSRFPEVYTKQALKLANKDTEADTTVFPNAPYTPKIKSLSLNYTSSLEIDLEKVGSSRADYHSRIEQMFHLYPFGQKEIHPYLPTNTFWAVPQFTVDATVARGHLCIGLKNAKASQIVSLLFQIWEGSGNPELEIPDITWLYLKNNEWVPFAKSDILLDSTNGLVKSGIIKFLLPSDICTGNTLLGSSLMWIKGTIPGTDEIDSLPDLIAIKAQAALARFKDQANSATHLATALPAETIAKLKINDPSIKSIVQPYSSFGGNVKETDSDFYRRISERLRHKDRAVTIWDYEHLVLQEFPSIHRVKCLNHTNQSTEIAPGHVMVVVIPDLRNKNAVNLLEPKVNVGELEDIRNFLETRNTLFVKGNDPRYHSLTQERIQVVNPVYEKVRVTVKIKVRKGLDPSIYQKQLNADIKRFLAPWAYDESAEIGFGNTLHRSVLLHFIEKLPYIDFLTDLSLEHFDGSGIKLEGTGAEIKTSSSRSILTSYGEISNVMAGIEHAVTTDAGCTD